MDIDIKMATSKIKFNITCNTVIVGSLLIVLKFKKICGKLHVILNNKLLTHIYTRKH